MASSEQILEWYDKEMRQNPPVVGIATVEKLSHLTRIVWDGALRMGAIQYSQLTEENASECIEEQCRYFLSLKMDFEWKYYSHDKPADLSSRLLARHPTCGDEESLVVFDLSRPLPSRDLKGLTLHKIEAAPDFQDISRVNRAVWDLDNEELIETLKEELSLFPERLSLYVVRDGKVPVATGWIRFYPGSRFSDLWGGSTLREYRGRGIYRALVALRAEEARRKGASYLCVDASSMSRPILEKWGFRKLSTTVPYYFPWKHTEV